MSEFAGGYIRVRGARTHNLKNIDVDVPKNALTVITGVSGCGKSSLAFDTIFAEGQRRYVESMSPYAREAMTRLPRPDVDDMEGLMPAVAVEQRRHVGERGERVADLTGLGELLALLVAKVGVARCPVHGTALTSVTPAVALEHMLAEAQGRRVMLCAPLGALGRDALLERLPDWVASGFVRYIVDGQVVVWDRLPQDVPDGARIEVVVDRLRVKPEQRARIMESIETALGLGGVRLLLRDMDDDETFAYSCAPACPYCDYEVPVLERRYFTARAAAGACPACAGRGSQFEPDVGALVEDPDKGVLEGALPLYGLLVPEAESSWRAAALEAGVPPETPWAILPERLKAQLLEGEDGLLSRVRAQAAASGPLARECARTLVEHECGVCGGTGLNDFSRTVYLEGGGMKRSLHDLLTGSVAAAIDFFGQYRAQGAAGLVASVPLAQIRARLRFIAAVGLEYLTLSRTAVTLSGGEAQRLRLSGQLGGGLTGVLYVLDEPTAGLHPLDVEKLLTAVRALRDRGNTVLMVEHSTSAMRAADWIIDMGPGAGKAGGRVLAQGTPETVAAGASPSAGCLARARASVRRTPRRASAVVRLRGACGHNLCVDEFAIHTGVLNVVCGVSGSGKSTLVIDTLYAALAERLMHSGRRPLPYETIEGGEAFDKVLHVDQSPVGRSARSIVATCIGVLTPLRELFAQTLTARERGYDATRFSFNVKGGRCEACEGEGTVRIDMEFLPDLWVPCELCGGRRYNAQTLEVRYKGRSMADVLDMSVDEAATFFSDRSVILRKLEALQSVGLGYVRLGQSAVTFSGGEAQRIKLAAELGKTATGRTLFVLDEPTAGLHRSDVDVLLKAIDRLIEAGNTVLAVEHNVHFLLAADRLVEIGPGAGPQGGRVVAAGTPDEVAHADTPTAAFLREERRSE